MRLERIGMYVWLLLTSTAGWCQSTKMMEPLSIELSVDKTTVMVFPAGIIPKSGVDRGNSHILAKGVGQTENVLKLKAATVDFPPTNLTVFTVDGKIYRFNVSYKDEPGKTLYDFTSDRAATVNSVQFSQYKLNPDLIKRLAARLSAAKGTFKGPGSKVKGSIHARMIGNYLVDGIMFFQVNVSNLSAVGMEIDFTRTYIKDRSRSKRTSIAQKEVEPLLMYSGHEPIIAAGKSKTLVWALEKFTIADNKFFIIEIYERSGDRHLTIKVKGKHLLHAKPLVAVY